MLLFQHVIEIKVINETLYILFFHIKSWKSGIYFKLTAHFNSDQTQFKQNNCRLRPVVCCDSWGRKESDTTERLN